MSGHEVQRDNVPDFVVEPTQSGFDVRRGDAAGVEDPFVRVTTYDKPDAGYPFTTLYLNGVQRFSHYATRGDRSRENVGSPVKMEVSTGLLDDAQKADLALKLAALAFDISGEQTV